jgi:hypothetical protein
MNTLGVRQYQIQHFRVYIKISIKLQLSSCCEINAMGRKRTLAINKQTTNMQQKSRCKTTTHKRSNKTNIKYREGTSLAIHSHSSKRKNQIPATLDQY